MDTACASLVIQESEIVRWEEERSWEDPTGSGLFAVLVAGKALCSQHEAGKYTG